MNFSRRSKELVNAFCPLLFVVHPVHAVLRTGFLFSIILALVGTPLIFLLVETGTLEKLNYIPVFDFLIWIIPAFLIQPSLLKAQSLIDDLDAVSKAIRSIPAVVCAFIAALILLDVEGRSMEEDGILSSMMLVGLLLTYWNVLALQACMSFKIFGPAFKWTVLGGAIFGILYSYLKK